MRTQIFIRHFRFKASLSVLISVLMLLFAAPYCEAVVTTWDAVNNNSPWDSYEGPVGGPFTDNWTAGIPGASDVARFSDAALVNPIRTIDLAGNRTVDAMIFEVGGHYTLGTVVGAETLTIGEGSGLSGFSLASSGPAPTWNVLNCNLAMNDTSGDNTFSVYVFQYNELMIHGVVSGGNLLRKEHLGTLLLTNANTYSGGTTIASGTVRVSNTTGSGTGTGAVTVESGSTLSGTGRVGGAITVNTGGTIAPGNSIGTLTALAGATLNGNYACEIGGASADRLAVTGTLNVRNGTLNVSQTSPWTGTSFTIATATQVDGPFGTVTGLPAGYSIVYGTSSIVIRPTVTFHVDAAAAPGGAGTNWSTALDTLDEALLLVGWGEEIWVKEGVYVPGEGSAGPYSTFEVPDGIQLLGGFGGTETAASQRDPATHLTVLSGDLGDDDTGKVNGITTSPANIVGTNAYNVVTVSFAAPIIDGFTITGGSALTTPIGNPGRESRGGGVFVDTDFAHVPTLSNCRLYGNTAVQGGAIFVHSNGGCDIESCDFRSNSSSGRGGAVYYWWSNVTTKNCNFSGNYAGDDGGAIYDDPQDKGSSLFVNCTITGNRAFDIGGAVKAETIGASSAEMINTLIWNNSAGTASTINNTNRYDFSHCLLQNIDLTSMATGNLNGIGATNDPGFILPLDPSLAPSMSGDFHPSLDAAIIDAGDNAAIAGVSLDLSGKPRIGEGTVDLGAYETLLPPNALSVVSATTGPTNVTSLAFTVLFSKAVTNFNALADLQVGTTGTANASGASFSGTGSNYTVTLTGVSGDGTLTLAVSTNSDVRDLFGSLLASSVTSTPVTLDHTDPTVTSITPETTGPTNATSVAFTVHFSEAVTHFDSLLDVAFVATGDVSVSGGSFSGSGSNYTVTLTGLVGEGTLTLRVRTTSDVRDLAGNPVASSVTSPPVFLDVKAPKVFSITPATTGPTNASSLQFSVLFTEPVLNFNNLTDLVVGTTGTASASGAIFAGSSNSYTVTLTGVSGDGTLTVRVSTASDVSDPIGNLLISSVTSAQVTVDHTPPTVASITPATTGPTSATNLDFTITFSEDVVNFDALGDLVVLTSGTVSVGGAMYSGSGSNYTVTLTGVGGDGTLTVAVATNTGVQDPSGNVLTSSATSAIVILAQPVAAVLHWPLDEGTGTNTLEAVSGQNSVASLIGPSAWAGGLAPGSMSAIALDIDSPTPSYVDAGTLTTNGNYVSGSDPGYRVLSNNWSITAWLRLENPQSDDIDRVIASSDTGGGPTWWLFFVRDYLVQEGLGFDFESLRVDSGLSLPLDQTVFVALTADSSGASFPGGTNKHQFAVWDGSGWQTALGPQFINIRLQGLEIGSFNNGTRQFDGVIDDVRIYDQTLTQAQLDRLAEFPPALLIAPAAAGQAEISWTPHSSNWLLQENLSLSPANWSNAPSGYTNPIVVPLTPEKRFYRLIKP